jgi:hypothetical protein
MTLACVDFVIFEYAKLFKKLQSGNMEPEERQARLVKTLWSRVYPEININMTKERTGGKKL